MVKILKKIYLYLILLFLYAPILVLAVFSFNSSRSRGNFEGFSLKWYAKLLSNSEIQTALYYTLLVAVIAAVISAVVGTFSAIGIHAFGKKSKALLLNINYIPAINPDIVTGVSLMLLFAILHLKSGFITLLLAHITFCIPYVILSVMPKLNQMDKNLIEAAQDLGATPLQTVIKVILPQIMPGILTGFMLAFTLSIDDFVISFFTTGGGVTNLSIYIYSMAKRGISPEINALSTIMIIVVSALLILVNTRDRKKNELLEGKH